MTKKRVATGKEIHEMFLQMSEEDRHQFMEQFVTDPSLRHLIFESKDRIERERRLKESLKQGAIERLREQVQKELLNRETNHDQETEDLD